MRVFACLLFFLSLLPLSAQTDPAAMPAARAFDEIFPGLPAAVREAAFSSEGFYKSNEKKSEAVLIASGQSGIDSKILESVLQKQPGILIETIMVIPGGAAQYSLLDVYNALGKVRGLQGRLYRSHTRNQEIPLFDEVTRIESPKKTTPVADPAPATNIPSSEIVYMRLKDANFGNSYYRADLALYQRGLCYSLTNNKNISYFFVPVIKEGKFIAQLYFEPIAEGILLYGLAGADVSDFVSSKISMPSAISKRINVIIGWVTDGISRK